MKVYVIESGCYSDRSVIGVALDLESAKAAFGPDENWSEGGAGRYWHNDKDWDDSVDITEFEISDTGSSMRKYEPPKPPELPELAWSKPPKPALNKGFSY